MFYNKTQKCTDKKINVSKNKEKTKKMYLKNQARPHQTIYNVPRINSKNVSKSCVITKNIVCFKPNNFKAKTLF